METSSKNNGNELKSPLDVFSVSCLNPFPKIAPYFHTMLFIREFFASYLSTSLPFTNQLHRRKKSKKNHHATSQENKISDIRHFFELLVCLRLLQFVMRVLICYFPYPSIQLIKSSLKHYFLNDLVHESN